MIERKVKITVEFDFTISPRVGTNDESVDYLQGMVRALLKQTRLAELQSELQDKIEDGAAEMEWDCERVTTGYFVVIGDEAAKQKRGRHGKEIKAN
jgi:hypothetical protein